jgi:hypothetical protein
MDKKLVDQYRAEFEYLYELQASGRTNMFGAAAYLRKEMGMSRKDAPVVLLHYMNFYDEVAKYLGIKTLWD